MNTFLKSEKKLNNASGQNKTPEPRKKQSRLQCFLNWLNRGTQKELRQQGACVG